MIELLADTSFIIDVLVGDKTAIQKAREIEDKGMPIMVSVITLFELYVGITLSKKASEEKNRINTVLESLPLLNFDLESSKEAGKIYGDKINAGIKIDSEDAMIAGIAKVKGVKVITRNLKHFQGIDGVTIEKY